MADKELIIIGAGTYGAVVYELAELNNYNVIGFYDDDASKHGGKIFDIPIVGKIDFTGINIEGVAFAVAIGNNPARKRISEEIKGKGGVLPRLIHPSSEISTSSTIGEGCLIHALTYIWTQAEIGDYTIVSPHVVVAHHSVTEKACFISTGSNIGAGVTMHEGSFIGIGSTIMTGVKTIGRNACIGAGSVVIRDVPENAVVVGNPARVIKYVHA